MKGLFVTGTDTGVGKTVVTASLVRLLRQRGIDAVAMKPFATGVTNGADWRDNDPALLSAAMDHQEPAEVIAPVRLGPPLSPYDAARLSGTAFDVDAVVAAVTHVAERHEVLLVEGVGGACVPLTEDVFLSDFIKLLGLPALVVARAQVGTINHSLLTVTALRTAGVHVEGMLFTRSSSGELALDERVGPETACRFSRVACFGHVNRVHELEIAGTVEAAVQALPLDEPSLQSLVEHLMSGNF